jgi:hypothetical protein
VRRDELGGQPALGHGCHGDRRVELGQAGAAGGGAGEARVGRVDVEVGAGVARGGRAGVVAADADVDCGTGGGK